MQRYVRPLAVFLDLQSKAAAHQPLWAFKQHGIVFIVVPPIELYVQFERDFEKNGIDIGGINGVRPNVEPTHCTKWTANAPFMKEKRGRQRLFHVS